MNKTDLSKKYQKLTDIEHILKRPSMYIGSITESPHTVHTLTLTPSSTPSSSPSSSPPSTPSISLSTITFSPGLYKLFDEALVNAYDQTIRDQSLTKIMVDISDTEISIYNDGIGIDVLLHPKEKIYIPELIFSHLRTSTSFDDSRISKETGGIHGLGIKLTAIFSTKMKIKVVDIVNKKIFSQTYKNHLSYRSPPKISSLPSSSPKHGSVKITFTPDFKYFGVKSFSPDLITLLNRRVYDIAALTRPTVKVYLNGSQIPIKTPSKYLTLITQSPQIQITPNIIIAGAGKGTTSLSFVNGIYTSKGGTHVDFITNRIVSDLKQFIEAKHNIRIKSQFIKDLLFIFISISIPTPAFSSQTKEELVSPYKMSLDDYSKTIYNKLELKPIIENYISTQQHSEIKKTEKGKKKKIKKLLDANYAGTKQSYKTTLILTEGDSAKTMAISGMSVVPGAHNYYGVFPLKGKLLNVREATHSQLLNNEEFINLKIILGLKVGTVYTKDNINLLRYGSIILMMDADVDGSHIKGLVLNMIHYYWPSLFLIDGFVKIFITPILKVNGLAFYTIDEYNKWKTTNPTTHTPKYYKGLGTNTATEAKEYFNNLSKHLITFKWIDTPESNDLMLLAFDKSRADDRKTWLKTYKPTLTPKKSSTLTNIDFINKELIHFSNYDNIRSIPSLIDGLKPSQRKVLYSAFKKNLITDIKVSQFVGYISENTSYHHGEVSLINTIINMAQNFIGSNNINLLMPIGQFGTRLMGGKDHSSARYIFTRLNDITRYIFSKLDDNILEYLEDDGMKIEPKYYVPIVPIILVNGAEGIGTGYSTYIPKFNIREIISELKNKLITPPYKFRNLTPYYNGFTGQIIKMTGNGTKTTNPKDTIFLTKGVMENFTITELPITTWTENYKEFLDNLNLSYKDYSTDTIVKIVLKGEIDEKSLGLTKIINLNNMYLHDSEGIIKKYDVKGIMEEFYKVRLEYYGGRKKYLLKEMEIKLAIYESKIKFINLVMNGKLKIIGLQKDKIMKIMEKSFYNYSNYDYLLKINFYTMTKEQITDLETKYAKLKHEYEILKKQTESQLWLNDLRELEKWLDRKEE